MSGRIPLTTQTQTPVETLHQPKSPTSPVRSSEETPIEVPYTDYEQAHTHPYTVDYFKLGDTWSEPEGGFPKEIGRIETYIEDRIKTGEIANSVTAIKNMIKKMEKLNNLTDEERAVVKVEVLSNYVEFLMKNDETKRNLRRYGTI